MASAAPGEPYSEHVTSDSEHQLRIGELGRRVGLKPELLRAWERRYGVLQPARSDGGLRLYSQDDERRVRHMQSRIADGLSPAEAARVVLAGDPEMPGADPGPPMQVQADRMRDALDRFDAFEAHAALDRLIAAFSLDAVLDEVVLPYLRDLGDRWEAGAITVAQEHFASNLLRGRFAALARGWEGGAGPLALLACAPGEMHDLPLLLFGVALRARGWRIAFLGADTPGESVAGASSELGADLVVVSSTLRSRFRAAEDELAAVARERPVALAGPGASESLAESLGCDLITDGPVAAAERVTASR